MNILTIDGRISLIPHPTESLAGQIQQAANNGKSFNHVDLSTQDFRNSTFNNVNFSGADLTECDFEGSTLINVNFRQCRALRAKFSNCEIRNCIFDQSDLSNSDFSGSSLISGSFTMANLQGAYFSCVRLESICFQEALISHANFSHTSHPVDVEIFQSHYEISADSVGLINEFTDHRQILNCDFTSCSLNGGQFRDRTFTGCDFTDAKITAVNFTDSVFKNCDFTDISLRAANFNAATLSKIKLSNSRLHNCLFVSAKLNDLKIDRYELYVCDFTNACFRKLKTSSIDDTGVVSFLYSNLENCEFIECDLDEITFEYSYLGHTKFRRTLLMNAEIIESTCNNLQLNEMHPDSEIAFRICFLKAASLPNSLQDKLGFQQCFPPNFNAIRQTLLHATSNLNAGNTIPPTPADQFPFNYRNPGVTANTDDMEMESDGDAFSAEPEPAPSVPPTKQPPHKKHRH